MVLFSKVNLIGLEEKQKKKEKEKKLREMKLTLLNFVHPLNGTQDLFLVSSSVIIFPPNLIGKCGFLNIGVHS